MEENATRPNKLTIERGYAPTRLSEETLIGIYDRVLGVAAEYHDNQQPRKPSVESQPEYTTTTGGQS